MRKIIYWLPVVGLFLLVFIVAVYLFFPLETVIRYAARNLLSQTSLHFSVEEAKVSPLSAHVKRIVLGHEILGRMVEIENVKMSLNIRRLLRGDLLLRGQDDAGQLKIEVVVPLIGDSNPIVTAEFKGLRIKVEQRDNALVPALTGILHGRFKKEISLFLPERTRGTFLFSIKKGEIKFCGLGNMPRITGPFEELVLKGNTEGPKTGIELLSLRLPTGSVKGSGELVASDRGHHGKISLFLEGFKRGMYPLPKAINVTGNFSEVSSLSFEIIK